MMSSAKATSQLIRAANAAVATMMLPPAAKPNRNKRLAKPRKPRTPRLTAAQKREL